MEVIYDFNPRSREGSDLRARRKLSMMPYFNPRSREGSDFFLLKIHCPELLFQSTLPRRERRLTEDEDNHFTRISIHAPAKGATIQLIKDVRDNLISIHAPAKGATTGAQLLPFEVGFQSTLPRRERQSRQGRKIRNRMISIHAPAKGATAFINIFSLAVRLFFISSHQ